MAQQIHKDCDPATCGCYKAISNLEKSDGEQWDKMEKITDKQDRILTRINVVLGSVVVALIMMVLNMAIK